MQLIPVDPLLARVEIEGKTHLGIRTSIPASGHSIKSLGYDHNKSALVLDINKVDYWDSLAVREHNKELILLGPWLNPAGLQLFTNQTPEQLHAYILLVIKAYVETIDLPDFHSDPIPGILTIEGNRIMVLPTTWAQGILHHCSNQDVQRLHQVTTFPGKKPDYTQKIAFFLGYLSYIWLTGKEPFDLEALDQNSIAELNEKKRGGIYKPLELFQKPISQDLISTIDELIMNPTKESIFRLQQQLHDSSLVDPLQKSPISSDKVAKVEKKWNQTRNLFQVRRYVQKKRTFLLATTLAIILIVSAGTQMIQRALTPPLSLDWTPEEVVSGFFEAANELDAVTMDGLVMENGARELRRTVVHLFATSRVREAHEMRNPHINAQQWVLDGRPEIPEAAMIFGIVNFQILEISPFEEDYRVLVRYELFMPDVQEILQDDGSPGTLTSYMVEEIEEYIFLGRHRNAWKIRFIERLL